MKFDHIGIVARDLASGRRLLENSIGVREWTAVFEDRVNDVWVQFGRCGSGICYEVLEPLSERSPISHALARKVNVINHVAYLVDDLAKAAERLEAAGFVPTAPARPAIAYGGRPIQFFVSQARMLIEMIEAPDHRHQFESLASVARQ